MPNEIEKELTVEHWFVKMMYTIILMQPIFSGRNL